MEFEMTSVVAKTTLFKNCDWVVAWDGTAQSHVYLRNADFVVRGADIVHVGEGYSGPVDAEIDARRMMIIPGFVDIHSHPGHEPGWKGMLEELGSPRLGQSSLYEFMPVFQIGPEYTRPALRVAASELLKSGVTTICDLGRPRETWADEYAETGIRAVLWGMFRSGPWKTTNGHSVQYDLDPATGDRLLREAIAIADAPSKHPSGRITGIIGHCISLNDHPWLHWPHANDFERLRDSGAQVAHCPVVFARRGIALNTLSRYAKAGIRCGISKDLEMLRRGQAEAVAAAPQCDWAGRSLEQLSPRVFPVRD